MFAWLAALIATASFTVHALVGDLLAVVHQSVYGVVLPLDLLFAHVRIGKPIALRSLFLRVRDLLRRNIARFLRSAHGARFRRQQLFGGFPSDPRSRPPEA